MIRLHCMYFKYLERSATKAHSVNFSYSDYIFNLPTKCKYTMEYLNFYQHSPTCFGPFLLHLQGELLSYVVTNMRIVMNVHKKICSLCIWRSKHQNKRLLWSLGSVLAFDTQVRGFKPDRSRRIFQGEGILSMPSFGGGSKKPCPVSQISGV
jgi:hypothetical protein